ncbi:MAG: hypothetical protein MUE44_07120 [Oscillatoriaceae cyanobacterium Prado104]|nr:hypothetical protein [Oscillatoriaceae cyanobacterium Prado104]
MNSHKYKIQALIAEIDEVLSKPAPRLPWTGSIDTVHQRHLLERVRTYLVSQDSKLPAGKKPPDNQNLPLAPVRVPPPPPRPPQPPAAARPSATEQIVQAVTEEIGNLRDNLTQPLQEDIQALRQEHRSLIEEIKQLEARRQQQQSLAQQQANQQQIISEFMQALTGQLQEAFARSAYPMPGNLSTQHLEAGSVPMALGAASDSGLAAGQEMAGELPMLTPAERLEQMQQFQARADSLMMRLDSTLNVVFETLHDNLQNYQESLEQGLDRMHGLGQQSEAMFAAWVNRLAEQLGRETYSWTQRPIDLTGREADASRTIDPTAAESMLPNTARSRPVETPIPEPVEENRSSDEIAEQDRFPYAGSEVSPQFGQLRRDRDRTPTPISLPDLEENLFGTEPMGSPPPAYSEAEVETAASETDDNVEDVYASLFATEEIADLELEPFVLENTETAAEMSAETSQTPAESPTVELLTTENLFANLLDEGESLGDFLAGEDSDFVIANSVEELTLDTSDLFEPQIAPPEVPQSEIPTGELQIDTGDRSAPSVPQQPVAATQAPEISPAPRQARVPSAQDVQTGEFGSDSDDFYIHASPDENLLPVLEEPQEPEDRSIDLDNNTLQQLEADLYNLEGLETSASGRAPLGLDYSEAGADNPFTEAAGEESGTLEDLFADVLAGSPSDEALDEAFSLEAELDAELFAESEDPNVTLDDILASLGQPDTEPVRTLNPEHGTVGETLPDSQKKKLISIEPPETAAGVGFAAIAPGFPESETQSGKGWHSNWYLGVDFGTTGLSAALLDRASGQLYPIFWEPKQHSETSESEVSEPEAIFRIPPAAVLGDRERFAGSEESALPNFKLPLKVGVPYLREAGGVYEPVFLQSPNREVSIAMPLQGLRALLATLNPRQNPSISDRPAQFAESSEPAISIPDFTCKAAGLEQSVLETALLDLRGVILGTPAGWSDAYRFNLREAVLGAGLVSSSSQIFVVEDAIATLLSAVTPVNNPNSIDSAGGGSVAGDRQSAPLVLRPSSFSGGTLIINAGATTVELALVDLPENIQDLTHADFACHSFDFGGDAFCRDIICQLLAKNELLGMKLAAPRPGHPDLSDRYKLEQQLQGSDLGRQLLAAARNLKVILQHQESFILEVDGHFWEVKRRDLETEVLVPFVQQLNRELNALLSLVGMSAVGINQAICTGGMGTWPAIARWLRQKLPNAIVIQDSELEFDREYKNTNFNFKTCRVARGLASLPLYPQLLDLSRQQYSDFFILWELMRVMGAEIFSFEEIVQLLQRAGVNTRNCEPRILAILEGKLPDGMVPREADFMLLTEESRQNPDWQEILAEPLFFQEVPAGYRLNVEHAAVVREYLGKIASDSQQKLLEPLTIAWESRARMYQ